MVSFFSIASCRPPQRIEGVLGGSASTNGRSIVIVKQGCGARHGVFVLIGVMRVESPVLRSTFGCFGRGQNGVEAGTKS
jgi:hypothetical protein